VPLPLRYWSSAERTLRYWIVQSKGVSDHVFGVVCDVVDSTKSTPPSLRSPNTSALSTSSSITPDRPRGNIAANSDEEWHRVFDVNVVGLARVSRGMPFLRRSDHAASLTPARSSRWSGYRIVRIPRVKALSHQSRWLWLPTTC